MLLVSCNTAPKETSNDTKRVDTTVIIKKNGELPENKTGQSESRRPVLGDSLDCDGVLNRLFQGSSYKPLVSTTTLASYKVHVDDVVDSTLSVQLFYMYKKDSAGIGWLKLDLRTEQLRDVSHEEKVVDIEYDHSWLKLLRNCSFQEE